MKFVSPLVSILSAEFLLTKYQQCNGGAVILMRSVIVAAWVTALLCLVYGFESGHVGNLINLDFLRRHLFSGLKIFGTILAFVYVALYARFSAQWRYLADVYNKIKESQMKTGIESKAILAQWKAGFIEDADELHLATKKIFMSILYHWLNEDDVREEFIKNTPCGSAHYLNLKARIDKAYKDHEIELTGRYK